MSTGGPTGSGGRHSPPPRSGSTPPPPILEIRPRTPSKEAPEQPPPPTRPIHEELGWTGRPQRRSAPQVGGPRLVLSLVPPGTRGSAAFSQRTIYGAAPSPPSVSPVETWGARTLREYEELRQARHTLPVPQTALIAAGRAEGSEETVTGGARRTPPVSSGERVSPTHSVVETARRAVRFVVAACSPRARTDEATSTLRTATQALQLSAAMAEPIPPEVGEEEEAPAPPVKEERDVPAPPVEEEIAPTPQVEARPTPRSARLFRPRPARVPPPLGDDREVDWFHIDCVITREEITAAVGRATYNSMCHQGKVRVVYSRDPRHPPSLALLGVPQKDILPLRLYTRAALEVDLAW